MATRKKPAPARGRATAKAEYVPASGLPWRAPEPHHLLLYHWSEGSDQVGKLPGWEDVRRKLREFSDRHCTYLVPGAEVGTYCAMVVKVTGKTSQEFLRELLSRGLLKPLQG